MAEDRTERQTTDFDPARVRAVLFDLDGTLLNVDMHEFIPAYLRLLAGHFADAVAPETFIRTMQAVIGALLIDTSGRLNLQVLYDVLERRLAIPPQESAARFDAFYADSLPELKPLVERLPQARILLEACLARGLRVVIATNPVFSREMIRARLAWGGIDDLPYALVTTLENSRFCKPHPEYFRQVLAKLDLAAGETVMVGNDTGHDLAARRVGIPAFLVDEWLIERNDSDYSFDWRGDHAVLADFLATLGTTGKN